MSGDCYPFRVKIQSPFYPQPNQNSEISDKIMVSDLTRDPDPEKKSCFFKDEDPTVKKACLGVLGERFLHHISVFGYLE